MDKRDPVYRLVSRRIPGTSRFGVRVVLIDPDTRQRVRRRKSKKERRRIRKRYEADKSPRPTKSQEAGRSLRYMGKAVGR